ncbi:hypothetical protein AOLI_G00231410 [Acnodon oligacanthus]
MIRSQFVLLLLCVVAVVTSGQKQDHGQEIWKNRGKCLDNLCQNGGRCLDRGLLCHIDDACIRNPCGEGQQCMTNPINGRAVCCTPADGGEAHPH